MERLPNDYSRCCNADCKIKLECLRYLEWVSGIGGVVSVTEFQPKSESECDNLIKMNNENNQS